MESCDWQDFVRAISVKIKGKEQDVFLIFNAYHDPISWKLPPGKWTLEIATQKVHKTDPLLVPGWSVVIFTANNKKPHATR